LSLYPLLVEEEKLMVGQETQYLPAVEGGTVAKPLGGGTADTVLEVGKEEHLDDKKPATKRKWYIIAAVLLVVAIVGGVSGALAAGGGGGSPMPATQAPSATETPLVEPERLIAVRSQLMGVISSAEALEDTSSPQYQALRWVADKDTVTDVNDVEQVKARYILAVFYFSLGGPNWLKADGWLKTEVGVCDWDRVGCDPDGMVKSIDEQKSVNLRGEIPSELQHLPMLGRFEDASVTHVHERANFFHKCVSFPRMQKS
jgi:hypothetical protein